MVQVCDHRETALSVCLKSAEAGGELCADGPLGPSCDIEIISDINDIFLLEEVLTALHRESGIRLRHVT